MRKLAQFVAISAGAYAFMDHTKKSALTRDIHSKQAKPESLSPEDLSRLKLFSVTDQTELANEIAFYFKTKIGKLQVLRNSDDEKPTVNVFDNVQSKEIYLICSFNPGQESVKESIEGLVTSISALRSKSPSKVNVVLPYYGSLRSVDKTGQEGMPSEEELSELLENAGADKIFTVNMHDNQGENNLQIPLVELDAHKLCANYFKNQKDLVIVYSDETLQGKVQTIQQKLAQEGHKPEIQLLKDIKDPQLINGRDVLLVDNIVDSGKPLYKISNYLDQLGARSINMFAIHGVITGETVDFINYSPIKQLVITNTLPMDSSHLSPKINQISVAKMIANTIAQSTFHKNLNQLHQEGVI